MLGGLALLILVLAVVAVRRRGPLRISADPQSLSVPPGGSSTLAITLRNTSGRTEKVLLDGAASRGWEIEIPEHVLELPGGGSQTVEAVVAASRRASGSELVLVAVGPRQGVQAARLTVQLSVTRDE